LISTGALPQTRLGEITALLQTPKLYLSGLLLRRVTEGGEGKRKGRQRKGGKNDLTHPLSQIPGYANVLLCHVTMIHISHSIKSKFLLLYCV